VSGKRLLQTRLPAHLSDWLREQADKEGMSMAMYLRRVLIEHKTRADESQAKRDRLERLLEKKP
jgi:hypothetical protein